MSEDTGGEVEEVAEGEEELMVALVDPLPGLRVHMCIIP